MWDPNKQIVDFDHFARTNLMRKVMGQKRFDFLPEHVRGQHGQRMSEADHLIDAAEEKVVYGHR
ncbi:hypothetical protein [Orrella marina]|uniref:hypothetical protein n=1 Tax=Orrella marina TaxID=2163011 RepID=UPI00131F1CC7|nr:hypothetical protein [Orrella marina]